MQTDHRRLRLILEDVPNHGERRVGYLDHRPAPLWFLSLQCIRIASRKLKFGEKPHFLSLRPADDHLRQLFAQLGHRVILG